MSGFRMILIFQLCILIFSTGSSFVFAAQTGEDVVVGVFPRRNAIETIKLFTPMVKHLSTELGRNVRLETAKNFPEFWLNVKNGNYDIVHYNQYHYIKSSKQFGYQVFAKNEEFGRSSIASAIVVRKDSGITNLEELRGKKIVFGGGVKAMVAYIGNTVLLRKAGLNAGDYIEEFSKNPPNATIATYYKRADAGGVGDIALNIPMVKNKIDVSQLQYLVKGDNFPHIPWALKSNLPAKLKTDITKAILDLNNTKSGKQILKKAHMTGISNATDEEYDGIRKTIEEFEMFQK